MSSAAERLLPPLPDGWIATPLRYGSTCLDGTRVPLNAEERTKRQGDYPYWGANGIVDYIDEYQFDEPLVLVGEDGAPFFDKAKPVAFFVNGKIWVNNHIHVLRVDQKLEPRFVVHALNATDFGPWIEGSTRDKLTQDKMGSILLPTPPLSRQRAIADYLDRETARLDALVAAKERVLGLLTEKRRALITRAVTSGLDPRAPLRDSGIPWLGDIPAHWAVKRLKFLVNKIEQGWSPECYSTAASIEEWGVLKAGCCNGGRFNPEENKALPPDREVPVDLEVRPGDVLMSRASGSTELIGSVALVPADVRTRLLLSDKTYRLGIAPEQAIAPYLVSVLGSGLGRFQIQRVISGAAGLANNIAQGDINEFVLPQPAESEQRAIVAYIDDKTAGLDTLRAATERTIALLTERRAALIAAAVTGQINVPEAVS
ncbi:MAG: restriction endonuclease subunit S [Myxococcota bacterium]